MHQYFILFYFIKLTQCMSPWDTSSTSCQAWTGQWPWRGVTRTSETGRLIWSGRTSMGKVGGVMLSRLYSSSNYRRPRIPIPTKLTHPDVFRCVLLLGPLVGVSFPVLNWMTRWKMEDVAASEYAEQSNSTNLCISPHGLRRSLPKEVHKCQNMMYEIRIISCGY